ncbi:MAG: acyltransferase family protein [Clostridia bacterium]|nr:acyltransferase family protein [Clostridia bacterium]
MEQERNTYIDVLRAVSILLVLVGHCIQYGCGMEYMAWGTFLYNPVFIFIYSFHMPLFMFISGYLFAFSVKKKKWHELLIGKAKQILIPLFC